MRLEARGSTPINEASNEKMRSPCYVMILKSAPRGYSLACPQFIGPRVGESIPIKEVLLRIKREGIFEKEGNRFSPFLPFCGRNGEIYGEEVRRGSDDD
jgi:hypothetical protein